MQFVWDENKDLSNQRKHKISFDTASYVFDDRFVLTTLDDRHYSEERWNSIGLVTDALLYVAHTIEDGYNHEEEIIRIISARKANSKEARRYCIHKENEKRITSPQIH